MQKKIYPIVEGHGEKTAIPVLLRKLLWENGIYNIDIGVPFREHRGNITTQGGIEELVQTARMRNDCVAIIVIIDADDDCPKELAFSLRERATSVVGDIPISVVLANKEYEAWLIASIETLRGKRGIAKDACLPEKNLEEIRGAKGRMSNYMGKEYRETTDQAALTEGIDIRLVHERSRSFRKLHKDFMEIVDKIKRS